MIPCLSVFWNATNNDRLYYLGRTVVSALHGWISEWMDGAPVTTFEFFLSFSVIGGRRKCNTVKTELQTVEMQLHTWPDERNSIGSRVESIATYNTPEHCEQTKEPMVMLMYVGPRWPQSKHSRLVPSDPSSRKAFKWRSSCFLRTAAAILVRRSPLVSVFNHLKDTMLIPLLFSAAAAPGNF